MNALLFALLAAAAPSPLDEGRAPTPAELKAFVLEKLDYDHQYFAGLLELRAQGRTDPRMPADRFEKEVARARANAPVLQTYAAEKAGFLQGKPFSAPPRAEVHREYANLLGLLNMMAAFERGDALAVAKEGQRLVVKRKEDFGVVRGASTRYYVGLYRQYFYLMASAHYLLGDDQKAVEWLAKLEEHADLSALKQRMAAVGDDAATKKALRLEALRAQAIAVTPFDDPTKAASDAWIGPALLEVLTADLARGTDLVVVERSRLDQVMEEVALALGGFTEGEAAVRAGKKIGASSLIVGSYQRAGEGLRLSLRLVDGEDGRVLGAVVGDVAESALFEGARRLVVSLLESVGWGDAAAVDELLAGHAPKPSTAKTLHAARLAKAARSDEARALFAAAVREDPAAANLYRDLREEFSDVSATLGVLELTNVSGDPDDAWMARGIVEALSTDLPKLGFSVVERGRVEAVLEQRAARGALDPAAARAVGEALAADFVVLGSVLRQAPKIRADVRFVDVRTGVVAWSTSVESKNDDFMALLAGLTAEAAAHFNQKLDDETLDQLVAKQQSKEEFERYVRAQLAKESLRGAGPGGAAVGGADAPVPWRPIAFWSALAGTGAGAAAAATGFVVGAAFDARAHELHGMQLVAQVDSSKRQLTGLRDEAALAANAWKVVGWTGVGVGIASLATLGAVEVLTPAE